MTETEHKMTPEENLQARAVLFKALGHPMRLLILNLVKMKPRHGEELAAILNLQPATISFHVTKLADAGLLTLRKDQYYHTYSLVDGALDRTLRDMVFLAFPGLSAQVQEDAYRRKVLHTFFKHGRLTHIPAQLKKRQIVLEEIANEFEPDRTYTEMEVNKILLEFHEDVAALRRGLVSLGLVRRERGIYRSVFSSVSDEYGLASALLSS